LALATMVFSVLLLLIGAHRTETSEALLARTHPVACEQKRRLNMSRFKLTVLGFLGFIVMLSVSRVSVVQAADNDLFRWDIVHINFITGHVTAGGHLSPQANDMSAITLTGSGTFRVNSGNSQDVTGGGTWSTSAGGRGNYEVTGFVSFAPSKGTFPSVLTDDVCDGCSAADAHAGLAVLKVAFDDGTDGVLTVSCALPGAPASEFEGVTVSKGPVDYWNRESGTPGNGDATLFHDLH
jgi:hypothetical protein